jgi:catechol 2,3-dioxygenase-like lactoylglutathione lyase family enzyme
MSEQRRDPAGRFQGVAHVTIPVRDLAIAERFYVGLLGAELRRRVDREAFLRESPHRWGAEEGRWRS